ncbi:MAG: tetratricopeptide repeat protein, partial [Clostridia bacterium]|nr:tetratricopeptide repeat protein [Clostridia bacterium]
KYYNEGRYVSALRMAHKELALYGGDGDVYTRLADIYEGMGLHASALNYWYRFLDIADEEDYPDIYEGIAVNYMNIGSEGQAAFYYNKLLEVDDTLTSESKIEIASAFAKDKKSNFRFTYPPEIADFSKELEAGGRAMKAGDFQAAIRLLGRIEKGSKQYGAAQETLAVAHLLADDKKRAEEICLARLADAPDDTRVLSTLAAVYLEEDKAEESLAIAKQLYAQTQDNTDDLYKVATVCCENGLHAEAYEKFCLLDEKMPYDGRMLYFKAVAAYKSGKLAEAEKAFDELCTIYPDAEVAKFFLRALRKEKDGDEKIEPDYFYHLPQDERERRAKTLLYISKSSKDEAALMGLLAERDGTFLWAFDEMDGADMELQYLALVAAVQAEADELVRDVLLDFEVADVLKIETIRMLFERNREDEVGLVLCHIYRRVNILPVKLGRKRRKKFLEGYAKAASKFGIVCDDYGKKIADATEGLYAALKEHDGLETVVSADDCACAIFLTSGIKELKDGANTAATVFGADLDKVQTILAAALGKQPPSETENGEIKDEID